MEVMGWQIKDRYYLLADIKKQKQKIEKEVGMERLRTYNTLKILREREGTKAR